MMTLYTLDPELVTELIKIKEVAPVGLLLCFCFYMYWQNKLLHNKIKEKDTFIEGISEKFFILAGKMEMLINQKSKD